MKRTFLYKAWQHNRTMGCLLAAFAVLTIIANLRGIEMTPFFVWGMYSEKEKPVQAVELLKTTINEDTVLNIYNYKNGDTRFYLSTPLGYYKKIRDNHNQDPTITFLQTKLREHYDNIRPLERSLFNTGPQQQEFLNWYARDLQQVTRIPVSSLRVEVVHAHYSSQNLITDSVNLFATWQKN